MLLIRNRAFTIQPLFPHFAHATIRPHDAQKNNLAEDNESITLDDHEIKHSYPRLKKKYWFSPYLRGLAAIYQKNYWPIQTIPLTSHVPNYKKYAVAISVNKAPTPIPRTEAPSKRSLPIPLAVMARPLPLPNRGYVEAGIQYDRVTANYGNWFNQYLKGFVRLDPKNSLYMHLANDSEYKEHGDYAALDEMHIINDTWHTQVSAGASNHSIFVPKFYIGGAVFRKSLQQRQLVTYLGAHAYWWRPRASTQNINPGFLYYFEKSWIIEMGSLINRSDPGGIYSASGYIVLTQGQEKDHFFIMRVGFGREAYLPLGVNSPGAVDYKSTVFTATWRQWLGKSFGSNIIAENYNNPYYRRYGLSVGLFMDF